MTLNKLEKAILLTISYSEVFNFPLKKKEIKFRLMILEKVLDRDFEKALAELIKKKFLLKKREFFFLPSYKRNIFLRKKRKKIALAKRKNADKFVSFAKKIPFIKAIIITGSLSTSNTDFNDDVDWLIVTAGKRLWIVRPLVLLIGVLFGKRRQRNGNHRDNSWCFNMFLEEGSLNLPISKRNAFTAHEVCQANFVFSRKGIEELFLTKNRWVKRYIPGFYKKRMAQALQKNKLNSTRYAREPFWLRTFLDFLNSFFYKLQYQYMSGHITRETVRKDLAFFHPNDTRGKIFKKWKKIINLWRRKVK